MDHQYIDMYLRKKKNPNYTPSSANPYLQPEDPHQQYFDNHPTPRNSGHHHNNNVHTTETTTHPNHHPSIDGNVDRVLKGTNHVQQFVDQTHSLTVQVETFEDKMSNLTKLVKLSQTLQDEKETEFRKQNHDLKSRLKRQEQISLKLQKDLDDVRSTVPILIRDAIAASTTPIVQDVASVVKALQDTHLTFERKLNESRRDVIESLTKHVEAFVSGRLTHLQDGPLSRIGDSCEKLLGELHGVQQRVDGLEHSKIPEVRKALEERVHSTNALTKETIMADVKNCVRGQHETTTQAVHTLVQNIHQLDVRLVSCEKGGVSFEKTLSELTNAFRDSATSSARKNEEVGTSIKEFVTIHEQTRTAVTTELQQTKEWAIRNVTRLKKHVDVINSELVSLRESHIETSTSLQQVKCRAEAEHEKLLLLLQQKSREANILTEIVDKEIQSIQAITTHHKGRQTHHHPQQSVPQQNYSNTIPSSPAKDAASTTAYHSTLSNYQQQQQQHNNNPHSDHPHGSTTPVGYPVYKHHSHPATKGGSIYDDLAFPRSHNTSVQN